MKKFLTVAALLLMVFHYKGYAQEKYGKTLNIGIGVGGYSGYYRYAGRSLPVFNINYEIDVAKNFTLAPFVSIYAFKDDYYYDNGNRYYKYKEVVVPIGIKGYYYFDDLLDLNSSWDVYAAASLGIALVNANWENGYPGDKNYYHNGNGVFADLHIGASYHFDNRIGVYLDLSSAISTIGLQIHGKN